MNKNILKTESKSDLNSLLDETNKMSSKIVACHGCTKCCESGVVYVLPQEKERLLASGVPLIEIDGVSLIKRKKDRSCSMLDKDSKKCTIYNERPFCCRAFPLDVFSRNSRLEWGVYTYCPEDRILPIVKRNGEHEIDIDVLETIISRYENNLSKDIINYLNSEDRVCAKIELLDHLKDDYKIIGPVF